MPGGVAQLKQHGIRKIIEASRRCAAELSYQVTLERDATAADMAEEAGFRPVGLP